MSAVLVAGQYLELLAKSRLLTQDEIDSFLWRCNLREETSSIAVARSLVRHGLLTRFQAERILNGNWRWLVLDGYKLLGVVGAGGMGWVYSAQEPNSPWKVAIKVLTRERRHDDGMLARMQLEAEAGLRLAHPNILRTIALNKTEDSCGELHYVVMELIQGITPLELLSLKRRIPWPQSCDIIRQTARGLQYAHDKGLVHRDIKPENLMIRSNGAVKILDFGLAMLDEHDEEFSMAMIFGQDRVGTADYVAPEQTVNSYKVDHRADIYSLGCTFYVLLTGQLPFPYSTNAKKLQGHRKKKPLPIRQFNTDVPDEVIAIVEKMIAKRPERRFQSSAEIAEILAPFARQETVEFDYDAVLAARVKQAELRMKQRRRRLSDTMSRTAAGSEQEPPQAALETKIRPDTQAENAGPVAPPVSPAELQQPVVPS